MSRERTVMMARIRNEGRWIRRNLERTFQVAKTVVLWDDGSTDNTEEESRSAFEAIVKKFSPKQGIECGWILEDKGPDGLEYSLHFIHSPFARSAEGREFQRVNEIRDKNLLWYYVKNAINFDYSLCLDGDEVLSLEAIRRFPEAWAAMDAGADMIQMPFLYLWDGEHQHRDDGVYGPGPDGFKQLRFPRIFTVSRITELQLFNQRFEWTGNPSGMHCGSVPQAGFQPNDKEPRTQFINLPIAHFGYIDDPLRRSKFVFYNKVDPGNVFEDGYKHIIGEPDRWAPGPMTFLPWADE